MHIQYAKEQESKKSEFESLLERTRCDLLSELKRIDSPSSIGGTGFEEMVFASLDKNAKGTSFEGRLRHTHDRDFPDIVDGELYGIEVKATKKDDWTSIGNSVLESSRDPSVKDIYLFFGKLGGEPDIAWRSYEGCLKGIAVTHYPRYQIDMKLKEGQSIFDKMNVPYDSIRRSDSPVVAIRRYYKSIIREGEALWWMDDGGDDIAFASAPVITSFSNLSRLDKELLTAELYVRFPNILSKGVKKYAEVAAFLMADKGVVSSSLRDRFSAGGRSDLYYRGVLVNVPNIVVKLLSYAHRIDSVLYSMISETHPESWAVVDMVHQASARDAWLTAIDYYSQHMGLGVSLSELYRAYTNDEFDLPSK